MSDFDTFAEEAIRLFPRDFQRLLDTYEGRGVYASMSLKDRGFSEDFVNFLIRRLGNIEIYVPMSFSRRHRDALITKAWRDGTTIPEIARRRALSQNQIRNILKKSRSS